MSWGVLLCLALVVGLISTHNKHVSEFDVYVLGAERMSHGAEIYRPEDAKSFTYPPFFAVPFMPFLVLPEGARRSVWFLVNALTFGGIVWLLRDSLLAFLRPRERGTETTRWIWIGTFALAGRHVASVFENQSHDMLVFAAVALVAWFGARSKDTLAGVAAGLGASFKATPLLFAPLFLWQRRFRACGLILLSTALFLWLPDVLFPRADGGSWLVAWYRTFLTRVKVGGTAEAKGAWSAWNYLNQNLAGTLYRLLTPIAPESWKRARWDVSLMDPGATGRRLITLGAQGLVLLHLAWCSRPRLGRGETPGDLAFRRLGEAGLVACCMVLLSPMSSKAHFCVLTVAFLFVVTHYSRIHRDPLQLGLLIAAFALGTLTVKGLVGSSLGNQMLARGTICWQTVVLMLATGRALRLGFGDTARE